MLIINVFWTCQCQVAFLWHIEEIIFLFLPFSKGDTQVILVYAADICGILSMPPVDWVSLSCLRHFQIKITQMTEVYLLDCGKLSMPQISVWLEYLPLRMWAMKWECLIDTMKLVVFQVRVSHCLEGHINVSMIHEQNIIWIICEQLALCSILIFKRLLLDWTCLDCILQKHICTRLDRDLLL